MRSTRLTERCTVGWIWLFRAVLLQQESQCHGRRARGDGGMFCFICLGLIGQIVGHVAWHVHRAVRCGRGGVSEDNEGH